MTCPGCGRAIGLYNRNGTHIADEYHYPYTAEVSSKRLTESMWRVEKAVVCRYYAANSNKGEKLR